MAPHLDPINNDVPVSPANPNNNPNPQENFLIDPVTGLPKFPVASVAPSGIGGGDTTSNESLADIQAMLDAVQLRLDAVEQMLPDDDTALADGVQQNMSTLQQLQVSVTSLQSTLTALQDSAHDGVAQDQAITALEQSVSDQANVIGDLQQVSHDPQPQNDAIAALQQDQDEQDVAIGLASNILEFVDFDENTDADNAHRSVYRMLDSAPAGTTLSIDVADFEPGEQITFINLSTSENMLVQNSEGGFLDGTQQFPSIVPLVIPPGTVITAIRNTGPWFTILNKLLPSSGQMIRLVNANTTADLNRPFNDNFKVPLMGNVEINDGGYSVANSDTLTVTNTGRYRISAMMTLLGNTLRQAPNAMLLINGNFRGSQAASAYIRNENGHSESSLHLTPQTINLNAGDTIAVMSWEAANGAGVVRMPFTGTSFIEVERIR